MRRICLSIVLNLLIIGSRVYGMEWWNNEYKCQARVTVTNAHSLAVLKAGWPVALSLNHKDLVDSEKSLASGDDIRIVYWNGSQFVELDRRNVGAWNSNNITIFFKGQKDINASSSDNNYWLYYNSPKAEAAPATKSSVYYDATTETGLVGYWSFDEGAGIKVSDGSGKGNEGQRRRATWEQGKFGQALDFDGSDNCVVVEANDSLKFTSGPFSLEAWVNFTSGAKKERGGSELREHIISKGRIGTNPDNVSWAFGGQNIEATSALINFTIYHTPDPGGSVTWVQYDYSEGFRPDFGNWHHYVATWDGTTNPNSMKIYIDGELKKTQKANSTAILSSTNLVQMGVGGAGPTQGGYGYLHAKLDEVRVYTMELTETEIREHYSAGISTTNLGAEVNISGKGIK